MNEAVLAAYGLSEADLLGAGWESTIYALGPPSRSWGRATGARTGRVYGWLAALAVRRAASPENVNAKS